MFLEIGVDKIIIGEIYNFEKNNASLRHKARSNKNVPTYIGVKTSP